MRDDCISQCQRENVAATDMRTWNSFSCVNRGCHELDIVCFKEFARLVLQCSVSQR